MEKQDETITFILDRRGGVSWVFVMTEKITAVGITSLFFVLKDSERFGTPSDC